MIVTGDIGLGHSGSHLLKDHFEKVEQKYDEL